MITCCFFQCSFPYSFFFFKIFYFLWTEGKGRRTRGRETSMCGCLLHAPTGDLACNAGMCPDWEFNQRPFCAGCAQSTEVHHPGPIFFTRSVIGLWRDDQFIFTPQSFLCSPFSLLSSGLCSFWHFPFHNYLIPFPLLNYLFPGSHFIHSTDSLSSFAKAHFLVASRSYRRPIFSSHCMSDSIFIPSSHLIGSLVGRRILGRI